MDCREKCIVVDAILPIDLVDEIEAKRIIRHTKYENNLKNLKELGLAVSKASVRAVVKNAGNGIAIAKVSKTQHVQVVTTTNNSEHELVGIVKDHNPN